MKRPVSKRRVWLFLDFDGVLSRWPIQVPFEHAPALEAVLKQFQNVDVVITSSWAHRFGLDEARSRLPKNLASRVIGSTYDLVSEGVVCRVEWRSLNRGEQIERYLRARKQMGHPVMRYLVLDDCDIKCFANPTHVIHVDNRTGLTTDNLEELGRRLQRLLRWRTE